jgi:Uma2 family endonuclease
LVGGDLIETTRKSLLHINTLHQLLMVLAEIFGFAQVTQERPVDVAAADQPNSEPESDIVVLIRSFNTFHDLPRPEEISLIVEISDTTLRYDLRTKASLYSRAGIAEYWVVDLNGRRLFVHRKPEQGRYASTVSYDVNESVTPLAAPEHTVPVRSLFSE